VIFRRQVPRQEPDGRQGHRTRGQPFEDHRKAPAGASNLYPVTGDIFRETKGLCAVHEQGSVAARGVELRPRIQRGQMRDELGRCRALLSGEHGEVGEEIRTGECVSDREDVRFHVSYVSRRFSQSGRGPGRAQARRGGDRSARAATSARKRLEVTRARPDIGREATVQTQGVPRDTNPGPKVATSKRKSW
jgi:hypothetical protein